MLEKIFFKLAGLLSLALALLLGMFNDTGNPVGYAASLFFALAGAWLATRRT
jgi:hypothetical protein